MIINSRKFEVCFGDGHCIRGLDYETSMELFLYYSEQDKSVFIRPTDTSYKAP